MALPIYTIRHMVDDTYVLPVSCTWVPPCISKRDACSVLVDSGFESVFLEDFTRFSRNYREHLDRHSDLTYVRERPDLVQYQRFPELGAKETVVVKTRQIIRFRDDDFPVVNIYYSSPKYSDCSMFQPVELSFSPLPGEYDALVYNPHKPASIVMGIREPVCGFQSWLEKCAAHPFQNIQFEPMAIMLRARVHALRFDEGHEALAKQALAAMEPVHRRDMLWGEEEVKLHMPDLYEKACRLPLLPLS